MSCVASVYQTFAGLCCSATGSGGWEGNCFDVWAVWPFIGAGVTRFDDFTEVFLYMDLGFFAVLKKAAPTMILGFGFKLLKLVKVKAFLCSEGWAVLAGAGSTLFE